MKGCRKPTPFNLVRDSVLKRRELDTSSFARRLKTERQSLQMRHQPHYHHAPAIKGQDAQHESNPWSNSKRHQIAGGNKTAAEVWNHSWWLVCGYQAESFLRLSELNTTTMNGMDDDGGIRRLPTSCYQRSRIDARCIGCARSSGHAKRCLVDRQWVPNKKQAKLNSILR